MKRLALILLVFVVGGVIVGSSGAVTATVTTCGATISSPGTYQLTADCSGDGITVTANNVTLRLNRHTMTGSGSTNGVEASNLAGLQVVGPGTLYGYVIGVNWAFVTGSRVRGVTITNSTAHGVALFDSSSNQFVSDTVTGSQFHGLTFNGSNSNLLNRVVSSGNGSNGVFLASASYNKVEHSIISSNGLDGIFVNSIGNGPADSNQITANTLNSNYQGIEIGSSTGGNNIFGNSAHSNATDDIVDDTLGCAAYWSSNSFDTANQGCIQ